MPYKYRKSSIEERDSLIEHRHEQGYPLHAPPHPYREAGWYFLSATNFEHEPIMQITDRRGEFESRLLDAFHSIQAEVGGWVVLPNHYHILADVDTLNNVSTILKQLHGRTSREWNIADGVSGRRRVWCKFTDRWIRNENHYYQALNYIHFNPVKHGYVDDPYAWIWSSVHMYLEYSGRDWLRAIWKDHPVGDFGSSWDDK